MLQFKIKMIRSALALCEIWLDRNHFLTIHFERVAERLSFEWELQFSK